VSADGAAARPANADGTTGPDAGTETVSERLSYHGYATADRLARALPERGARWLGRVLASSAYLSLPAVRRRVAENQAQVLGLPVDDPLVVASTKEAFRLYLRYWVDTFRLRDLSSDALVRRIEVTGADEIDRALEGGRGVIAVLPHLGNWDAAGAWVASRGIRIASVAEELRPPRLFDLFLRHREQLGMKIVGLTKGGGVGRALSGLLADGWFVALVADRDLSGRGVPVEMFGRTRTLPAGPALLSLTTGAPILVCPVWTTRRGWKIAIEPPIALEPTGDRRTDVAAITRAIGRRFEAAIAANPADWHMFQPGWPAPRDDGG
jgi:KDO2-lipid IV(A) lauroyltransferase